MRFVLFLLALLSLHLPHVWAQAPHPALQLSETRTNGQADRTYGLIDFDHERFCVLRVDRPFTYGEVETYDPALKLQNAVPAINIPRRYIGAINLLHHPHVLYMRYRENPRDNSFEQVSIYAKPFDRTTMQLTTDSIALIPPFTMRSNFWRGDFAVSPDRKLVVFFDYEESGDIEGVKALTNNITLRVFDARLKLLWERKVDLAPDGTVKRIVAIKSLRISNTGEVAILTDIFRNEDYRTYEPARVKVPDSTAARGFVRKRLPTTNPTLFFVGAKPEEFVRFTPNLGDYFYNQLNFTFDKDGAVLWFGCYSAQSYDEQSGVFYLKINPTRTKVLFKKRYDFNAATLEAHTQKKVSLPLKPLREHRLVFWRIADNGNLALSLEHQPFGISNFKAHNLLLITFAPTGDTLRTQSISKFGDIGEEYRTFLSHYLTAHGNDFYLIYNSGTNPNDRAFALKVDANGQITTKTLFRYDGQAELFCPMLSYALGDGRIFICLQNRFLRQYRFGVLDLPLFFQ